jgi:excinuclease ABC subunit C
MESFSPKEFLQTLTTHPGIYEMIDADGEILYVGKARNLKKRVSSYFQRTQTDAKTHALVEQIQSVTVTITPSENEALLLECNLIKKLKPRYNILLKDDKSYPYLYLSEHQDFPRLDVYRGPKKAKGRYFGPFPNAGSVRETLTLLQKIFKLRQCSDHFFSLRTRPCLQYFIERCTAPCVGYIDKEAYQQNVRLAELFLLGKNSEIIETLAKKMEEASGRLDYEAASLFRDQIVSLRRIQQQQGVSGQAGDIDVIAAAVNTNQLCIQVLYIRGGRLLGNKAYFPDTHGSSSVEEALSAFLPQYYLDSARGEAIPQKIIINKKLEDATWIAAALSEQLGKQIRLTDKPRGKERKWYGLALTNAQQALQTHLAGKANMYQRFENLQSAFKFPNMPQRIECFDVSHTMGEATVASCVVFDTTGPLKKEYRRFNIENITKGDDYAALTQAITRRYTRLKTEERPLPDLLMIDGGKGQLRLALKVLEELQITSVNLIAIAKGPERKAGLETLFLAGHEGEIHLPNDSAALHLLQQVRDEAHRFAIIGHRKQRAKARSHSPLENIPGIGAKRRRELLRQFGGYQEILRAGVEDIVAKVPGINRQLAQRIFDFLHGK